MRKLPKRGERTKKAKSLTPKQKKIARAAKPRKKITGADFTALRKKKTMKRGRKK
tara:strand:- start:244 stop:408 length:165 start_codon:yes stop_codon:yes gene_type:complete